MPYRGDKHPECPHCEKTVLSEQTIQWIRRHACTGCAGVWFDSDDLAELAEDLRLRLQAPLGAPKDDAAKRNCPRCSEQMIVELVAHKKDTVPVDICHDCGVWFDKDELAPFLEILMAAEDANRSPFSRTNRPWWAATLSFLLNSLSAGGSKSIGR